MALPANNIPVYTPLKTTAIKQTVANITKFIRRLNMPRITKTMVRASNRPVMMDQVINGLIAFLFPFQQKVTCNIDKKKRMK